MTPAPDTTLAPPGRLMLAAACVALAFAGLATRAGISALSGDRAENVRPARVAAAAATRGDIVDRRGEILATTLETHSLYADPTRVWDPAETAARLKEVLPSLDAGAAAAALAERKRFVWLARGLTPRQRQAVFELGLPGLGFKEEPRRVYPRGRLAAHVLGFTTIDGVGAAGAERAFDKTLAGQRPLSLSIDLRVQYALDEELRQARERYRAKAAIGLVTDVRSGEILALASLPDFDPNNPQLADAEARLNRAMAAVYELGSVFKTVTYAASLDLGYARPGRMLATDRPVLAGDAVVRDHAPSGAPMSVSQAFVRSSNVGAAILGLEIGESMQRDYLARLGLLDRAAVGYAESARPLLPERWDAETRATVSYGHGVAVTPVAFAAAFGAIANGGVYRRPTLEPMPPGEAPGVRALSEETSASMLRLMRAVVTEGTGRRADVAGFDVAGKTGTAEKAVDGRYAPGKVLSTFAAVFPATQPRYAVIVMLDEPKGEMGAEGRHGAGWTAAPTVGAVIARVGPLLGVTPRPAGPATLAVYSGGLE